MHINDFFNLIYVIFLILTLFFCIDQYYLIDMQLEKINKNKLNKNKLNKNKLNLKKDIKLLKLFKLIYIFLSIIDFIVLFLMIIFWND